MTFSSSSCALLVSHFLLFIFLFMRGEKVSVLCCGASKNIKEKSWHEKLDDVDAVKDP